MVALAGMSHNVLIVEDEVFVALEMQGILEDHGFHVVGIASDLPDAMAFGEREIDLALVDLNLRDGLTGPQIGAHLANERNATVLFVTANPRILGDGVAGTVGVLTKPTDEESLLAAVQYALSRRGGAEATPPAAMVCFG